MCQQVYSAAFIGHIEALFDDHAVKNSLTHPVPQPNHEIDYAKSGLINFKHELAWPAHPELVQWKQDARLAGISTRVGTPLPPADPPAKRCLQRLEGALEALVDKAEELNSKTEADREPVPAGA